VSPLALIFHAVFSVLIILLGSTYTCW